MKALILTVFALLGGVAAAQNPPMPTTPQYRYFQELVAAKDTNIVNGTYACFYDDLKVNQFFLIKLQMFSLNARFFVNAFTYRYTDGVSASPSVYGGELDDKLGGVWSTMLTMMDWKGKSGIHLTDAITWSPETVSIKSGFGEPLGSELRITSSFTLQRSTGRFIEDTNLLFPPPDKPTLIHQTGRCISIGQSVEEQYHALKATKTAQ